MSLSVKISNQFPFQKIEGRVLMQGLGTYSRGRLLDTVKIRDSTPRREAPPKIGPPKKVILVNFGTKFPIGTHCLELMTYRVTK